MKKVLSLVLALIMLCSISFAYADDDAVTLYGSIANPVAKVTTAGTEMEYSLEGIALDGKLSLGKNGLAGILDLEIAGESVVDVLTQLNSSGILYLGSSQLSKAFKLDVGSMVKDFLNEAVESIADFFTDDDGLELDDSFLEEIYEEIEDMYEELESLVGDFQINFNKAEGKVSFLGGVEADAVTRTFTLTAETPIDLGFASGLKSAALVLSTDDEKNPTKVRVDLTFTDENDTAANVFVLVSETDATTTEMECYYGETLLLKGKATVSGDKILYELADAENNYAVSLEITDDDSTAGSHDYIVELCVLVQDESMLNFSYLNHEEATSGSNNIHLEYPAASFTFNCDSEYTYTEADDTLDLKGNSKISTAVGEDAVELSYDFNLGVNEKDETVDLSGKESIDLLNTGDYDWTTDETLSNELMSILYTALAKATEVPALNELLNSMMGITE